MATMTKNLLAICITSLAAGLAFVTGVINVEHAVALYVALPLGAVFFGLFLISRMLEKEVSLYDEEHPAHSAFKKTTTAKANAESPRHSHTPREAHSVTH